METSSFKLTDIAEFHFSNFTSYYNLKNGISVHIPNTYLSYRDKVFEMRKFYSEPNRASAEYMATICINLTSKCNLRCKYCFNDKTTSKDLSVEDAYHFIDQIIEKKPNVNRYFVDLAGSGEPLLALKKIIQIADYCRVKQNELKKDVVVRLATNGVLLTPEVAKVLKEHYVLFGISLDGYKEIHDKERVGVDGRGTYDEIMKNYDGIENKDFIGVAMTFNSSDVDIYKAYLELDKKFETISIRPSRRDYSNVDMEYIIRGYNEIKEYIITQALYNNSIRFLMKILNGDDFFGKTILKVITNAYAERRCDAGISRFALGSDGEIYPCSAYVFEPNAKMNIDEEYQIPKAKSCENCNLRSFCGGMCPLQAKEESGNEKLCLLKKKTFEMALEIVGSIQLGNRELYAQLIQNINQILIRALRDMELVKMVEASKGQYTYNDLQTIKFNDMQEYIRIKNVVLETD